MAKKILVTGGAGFVGSKLVPRLLEEGHEVKVLDTFWYGDNLPDNPRLTKTAGDIRNRELVFNATSGFDTVMHLACISNDPSFDLDPALGRSINLDAFENVLDASRLQGIERFIYASSSSVYGIRSEDRVTETSPTDPLTDYSRFKLDCERRLHESAGDMPFTIIRPATVCGYSPRLRLDLVVNLLTILSLENDVLTVLGGPQKRPNIHIDDMVESYIAVLNAPTERVDRQAFNVGFENYTVEKLARTVLKVVGKDKIEFKPTNDNRSYHIDSSKISEILGFKPSHTIEQAVEGIVEAYRAGKIHDGWNNPMYHNVKRMKELNIK